MVTREDLLNELKVKLDILLENYHALEKYKDLVLKLQEENNQLKQQLKDVQAACSMAQSNGNTQETRKYISQMIREIDKCMALLKA